MSSEAQYIESIQLFRAAVAYMRAQKMPIPTVLELAEMRSLQVLPEDLTGPDRGATDAIAYEAAYPSAPAGRRASAIHAVPRITEVPR